MDSSHSNSSLCAEASEELEALFAIFGDDVRYIQPSDGFASAISMHFRPRTADDALNSFVTADLIVYLPQAYPACLPLAKLSRSSGFGDDGAALAAYISACLSKSALGEPLLMNLFEYIFDFLDGLNEGECLICNESLQSAAGGELAVRTNCYHCFHIHCLCRWGAVLHIANLNAKTGSIEHTKAASAIKSLEGDLRALEETKLNTESEISRLEEEIASILKTLGSMCTPPIAEENNKTSKQKDGKASSSQTVTGPSVVAVAPHVNVNKKGRKGMTDQQPACTSAPTASVNTAKVIEEELSKDERRHMRNQCNNYASALSVARQRHEKIIARIALTIESIDNENKRAQAGRDHDAGYPHEAGVKCPFCTMVISESTHPHIASVLRNGFNCALVKQFAIQQGVETSVDVGSQSSKSKLSAVKETAGGVLSVLSLPPSLVEMVRSIQLKQADLKARLHLKADSFT